MKKLLFFIFLQILGFKLFAQSSDYTLESLIAKIKDWGYPAINYNDYKFEITKKQFLDAIIGSTLQIPRFPIDGSKIQVDNGLASIVTGLNSWDDPDDNSVFKLSYYTKVRFLKNDEHIRATTSTGGPVSPGFFYFTLIDNSDRLAMELDGISYIKLIGRIKQLDINWEGVFINVELISWSKVK